MRIMYQIFHQRDCETSSKTLYKVSKNNKPIFATYNEISVPEERSELEEGGLKPWEHP